VKTASRITAATAENISTDCRKDAMKACDELSEKLTLIGDQLAKTANGAIIKGARSVDGLSLALKSFGSSLQDVGENHKEASKLLGKAIVDGTANLHEASKEIRTGMIGFGQQAATVVSVAAVFVVIYFFLPAFSLPSIDGIS
jgi:hypothetical protein